jgi:hypothetical protein
MELAVSSDSSVALKTKRRWFAFSLKTLLVVMTALAVWLGLYVKSFRDRRNAVAEIERLDGAMGIKYLGPEWLRKFVDDEKCFWDPAGVHFNRPLTVNELKNVVPILMSFQRLHDLTLPGDTVTDDTLPLLMPLAGKITYLDLSGCRLSDDAFNQLTKFEKLKRLGLDSTLVSSSAVEKLQQALPKCKIDVR